MRTVITALLLNIFCLAQAQLIIDGRHTAYDSLTNTMLATVPEALFGQSAQLSVGLAEGYAACTVDGEAVSDSCVFSDIEALKGYHILLTDTMGNTVSRRLEFTFLPIICLSGNFSNDYLHTLVLFSDPTARQTDTLAANVKWRGGTTNTPNKHKRNYKIKLDADTTLLGLRNDNNWILDAGQPDVFRLRNRIAMDIWNSMATPPYYADQEPKARNGVSGRLVEVFLDDDYRGFYNLSEAMDRKQMKLKKIDKQTGEIRGCLYKGVTWSRTQMFNSIDDYDNTEETLFGFEVKYPDLQDSDTTDWSPLVAACNFSVESADEDFRDHIADYFDMPVVMDYNIFFNVVNAVDNAGKNMYWAIYDKTQTQRLTPTPWDLDATLGQRWGGQLVRETDEGLCTSPDYRLDYETMTSYRHFRDNFNDYIGKMNTRYRQLRQPGQPLHTDSLLAVVSHYYRMVKNSGAAAREQAKWSGDSDVWGDTIDFDREYAYICNWISQRMTFIDATELPLFYKSSYFDELDVSAPTANGRPDDAIRDLSGRIVATGPSTALKPGVYIRGGRKIIIKKF